MKVKCIFILAVGLAAGRGARAQGTMTYLSSLSQTSTGNAAAANDSWLAAPFETGNNSGGYLLNSVELGMANATGKPSGFTVMVYTLAQDPGTIVPGNSIATLNGSLSPLIGGVYTYTDPLNLTLSADTFYFIVVTSDT